MKKTNLVVGAGFSGATIARKIAEELNEQVIVIDRKPHLAGNAYDYCDKNGIMIHQYGSHIFHTSNEEVWHFVTQFADFNQYMHQVLAVIDGLETHIPFNLNTIYDLFPPLLAQRLETKLLAKFTFNQKIPIFEFQKQQDPDLLFLSNYVYEKIFLHYTTKQWGVIPSEVDKTVTARVPVYLSKDNRYFQDKYQGIPLKGYNKLITNMLDHPNIELQLNTDYKDLNQLFDRTFYSGAIDEYFHYEFGPLPYRSVKFKYEEYNFEFYQNNAVLNYPNNYDFTRIHEYKHYLKNKTNKTVIAKEYSEPFQLGKNERYYPIPNDENRILYHRYFEKAKNLNHTYFLGRLGNYQYYNMDQAVAQALKLFKGIKSL